MIRASVDVNCQSRATFAALRSVTQAATSAASVPRSAMRRSEHGRPRALNSISATLGQEPCLAV